VQVPELDEHVIGLDAIGRRLPVAPTATPTDELPPPLDEFDLVVIELSALRQEIERRSNLAQVSVTRDAGPNRRPTDALENTAQSLIHLLEAIPQTAQRRQRWMADHVRPLLVRTARLGGQTLSTRELEVELGPYHADARCFPVRATTRRDGVAGTSRGQLYVPPELARSLYDNWPRVSKSGTLAVGLGGRRTLRDVRLADISGTPEFEVRFDEILTDAKAAIVEIALSATGRFVAVSTAEGVEVHDFAPGGKITRLRAAAAPCIHFHPDGKLLAIAATSCTLWNVETQQAVSRLTGVNRAQFSPDGAWLLTGSRAGVSLVSLEHAELRRGIEDPGGEPLTWCPDGRYFLIQNRLLQLPACRPVAGLPLPKVLCAQFNGEGTSLAVAGAGGEVLLFGVPESTPTLRLDHQRPVRTLSFSPDGTLLATGQGSNREATATTPLCLWNTKTGTLTKRIPHPGPVSALAFSPDGAYLLVGTLTGRVRVLHAAWLPDDISD
jgi:hypothetical protein